MEAVNATLTYVSVRTVAATDVGGLGNVDTATPALTGDEPFALVAIIVRVYAVFAVKPEATIVLFG